MEKGNLIISRRRDESAVCRVKVPGMEDVEVIVGIAEIRGDKVWLSIAAPKDLVSIHRSEVQQRIDREQRPKPEIED